MSARPQYTWAECALMTGTVATGGLGAATVALDPTPVATWCALAGLAFTAAVIATVVLMARAAMAGGTGDDDPSYCPACGDATWHGGPCSCGTDDDAWWTR